MNCETIDGVNYELSVVAGLTRNRLIGYIFSIIFACMLFSCEDKTVDYGLDTYYVEIVTAQNKNEFLSDAGKMIIATSKQKEKEKTYAFGDRVLLNYTVFPSTTSIDKNTVRINGSTKIPQGKLALSKSSTIESAVNKPVRLESVWLGSHYLNMQFYLNYKSETHKIGLVTDSTRIKSDTIRMYFIHDTNNDPPGYPSHAYLSFDLEDVLGLPGKARPISVQINTSNYGNKTYEFEY